MSQARPGDLPNCAAFLGWNMQGNFGPFTCYQNRQRRPVWYLTTPQKEPPSYGRQHQKNRLRACALTWQALSAPTRANWMLAARRANLRLHGYDLWTWYFMRRDPGPIRSIERFTGVALLGET